jgi:hypothetical protein
MKRVIVGLATTVLLSGFWALAGLELAAGTAHADQWCPGQYVWPGLRATGWDLSVCHEYHEECPPGYFGGCPDNIVEGPAEPPPPPIISADQCRALNICGLFP